MKNRKGPNTVIVEKEDEDFYGLRITEGEYENVIFIVGKLRFVEDKEKDECVLEYDFKIDKTPEQYNIEELNENENFKNTIGKIDKTPEQYNIEELNENENFKNTIGDILVDILEDSVDYNAEKSKETNTEQSDT